MAQALVDRGAMRPEEAHASRLSHLLWSCIGGTTRAFDPEVHKATLMLGDILLLCSDGLTARLPDAKLLELLQRSSTAEETCRQMVQAANEAGGPDNITVVVARFRDAQGLEGPSLEHAAANELAATESLELPSVDELEMVEAPAAPQAR